MKTTVRLFLVPVLVMLVAMIHGCAANTPSSGQTPTVTYPEETHLHHFWKENASAEYLKSEATCFEPAVYYYSCDCDEMGAETFVHGTAAGHSYQNHVCTRCGDKRFSEGLEFRSNGDGTCSVTGIGTCTDTVVMIPALSPTGDRVTGIGSIAEGAPFHCNCDTDCTMVSLILPEGITVLSENAIRCARMMYLTIPDSVTEIAAGAVSDSPNLVKVTIGSGVKTIGADPFGSKILMEIYNRSSLPITAGSEDFGGIARNVKHVYTDASEESKLFTTRNGFVFYANRSDRFLLGHESIHTQIELILPSNCNGSNYVILKSVFSECDNLLSVTIPGTVTEIGEGAFAGCGSLKTVNIGKGVTVIGENAFSGCGADAEGVTVILGIGIRRLEANAFSSSNIEEVYYYGTASDWDKIEFAENADALDRAERYYYAEKEPDTDGNYWHRVDGKPTKW